MWTTAEATLGGGTKAERWTGKRDAGARAPLGGDRQPAIGIVAGPGDDPLGHFLLEHEGEARPPGLPVGASQRSSSAVPTL
jgi:hypothetical protein